MSMDYIRKHYNVPAKRGARIKFTGGLGGGVIEGNIVGSKGHYLRVQFDGSWRIRTLHPTWEIEYLPPNSK